MQDTLVCILKSYVYVYPASAYHIHVKHYIYTHKKNKNSSQNLRTTSQRLLWTTATHLVQISSKNCYQLTAISQQDIIGTSTHVALTMKVHFMLYNFAVLASFASSFVFPDAFARSSKVVLHESNDEDQIERKIPLLPAIGGSSFSDESLSDTSLSSNKHSLVGDKFEIQYTCKVCETRNSNRVSRIGTFTRPKQPREVLRISQYRVPFQLIEAALSFAFARDAPVTIGSPIISVGPII